MTNILIVDDQASFRRQLRKLLELAGMNVIAEAGDIAEAKEMVREFQPDLAVVDVMLPGTNGIDGTPQLKALSYSLCVILISAYQDFHDAAKEVGAEVFVSKGELDLETVRAWVVDNEPKEEVRNEK